MLEPIDRLKNLSDQQLMDAVKNYKQYNYSEDMRNAAIKLLDERGIDLEILALTGNLNNPTYDRAKQLFEDWKSNRLKCIACYIGYFLSSILLNFIGLNSPTLNFIFVVIAFFIYFFYLFLTYKAHINFYTAIRKPLSSFYVYFYIFIGIIFFVFISSFFKSSMEEELKSMQ